MRRMPLGPTGLQSLTNQRNHQEQRVGPLEASG